MDISFITNEPLLSSYFTIINTTKKTCELKSNASYHYWRIIATHEANLHFFILEHKYTDKKKYHYQTEAASLLDTVLYIVDHDEYIIKRPVCLFDELLKKYK